MMNLNDQTLRLLQVRRYLDAETSIEEERELSDYYRETDESDLSEEELDVRLLLMSKPRRIAGFEVSSDKAEEFDRLMVKSRILSKPVFYWVAAIAATVIGIVFFLSGRNGNVRSEPDTGPGDMEQLVRDLMSVSNFQGEQTVSYQLQPVGDATIVTRTLTDGTQSSYIVTVKENNSRYRVIPIKTKL